jgi:hypothetical protein
VPGGGDAAAHGELDYLSDAPGSLMGHAGTATDASDGDVPAAAGGRHGPQAASAAGMEGRRLVRANARARLPPL